MFLKKILWFWFLVLITLNLRSLTNFILEESSLVRYGGDSSGFTISASELIAGRPISPNLVPYVGYIGLVYLSYLFRLGDLGIVIVQIAMALVSGFCMYDLLRHLGVVKPICKLFTVYYLTNYELMKWSLFILSDSWFITLGIISVWSIVKFQTNNALFLASGVICLLTYFSRPNGFIFFLTWLAFVYGKVITSKIMTRRSVYLAIGFTFAVVAFLSFLVLGRSAADRSIFLYATNGELIWSYKQLMVTITGVSANSDNSFFGFISYTLHHPLTFLQLFSGKIILEVIRIRPYLPLSYNVFILMNLIPLYTLALFRIRKSLGQLMPIILPILLQLILIGLTYADWDGRFIAYVLPLIVVLSAEQAKIV